MNEKLASELYDSYANFENLNVGYVIESYTGSVFKQLSLNLENLKTKEYLQNNVRILSAFYGIQKPFDKMAFHRLDFNVKIQTFSLYSIWKAYVNDVLSGEDIIINLASKEFSKLIELPMITIDFMQVMNGEKKSVGTYNKRARGKFLNYCIENQIHDLEEMKKFSDDGYTLEEVSKNKIVFMKKI